MERFKVETGCMKGAPECMRIFGFMHGVNNPKLTKRLNEHVLKTMEEMMITTTAFIRGKAATASKNKGHISWRTQDQSKRQTSEKRSNFRGHPREGRGSSRFNPLTRTPKEIIATVAGKFQPPPPMVTQSSNKFCDFHNDKGHSTDECMQLKKQIEELVQAGDANHSTRAWMNFMIVRTLSSYNCIIGRPGIKEIQAVPSTSHGMLKFPADVGIVTIRSTIFIPAECATMITSSEENLDILAWHPSDMTGVPRSVAEHRLNIWEGYSPVRKKKRGQAPERTKAIQAEVQKLVEAWIMRETEAPQRKYSMSTTSTGSGLKILVTIADANHSTRAWMNFMIVRTLSSYNCIIGRPGIKEIQAVPSTSHGMLKFPADGGIENLDILAWHPSDMTGVPRSVAEHRLNIWEGYSPVRKKKRGQAPERTKAIQAEVQKLVEAWIMREDCYPFSEIDWKVESLFGYPFKCFLDAYKGYHQIQLAESDEEKTAFHTVQGVCCYTKMPFSLKNVGTTYQRLVDKAFDNQIGQNKKVYVDDLVIKSHTEAEMLRNISETFRTLRKINIKLNPNKSEKSLSLFKTLKKCIKKSDFHWTSKAKQAFKQLKQHLSELPLLVAPKPKEELIVYLSASYGAISAILMNERGMVQTLVYFIRRALQGPELKYTPMEKLVISLLFAAKRLRRTITKMKRHAGRTQYHIPAKDVSERTGPSGFPCRNDRRKSARCISSRNSTRVVDTLHEWIVMCGRVRC
uniref:Reverse transcriptase domain-containing protein n=1 Tax=Tanacetum cinerariifolium TaxID=118510 RepID=A0A699IZY8_TANCI|nr:reverse transcriptase domain-containing protein [Tanacetum cinerariifolium]